MYNASDANQAVSKVTRNKVIKRPLIIVVPNHLNLSRKASPWT
jgi:hypothetical protein